MKKQVAFLVAALLLVAVLVGAAILYNNLVKNMPATTPASTAATASGTSKTQAPDFTVQDADGNDVALSSLFGKPMVLNFWASWCSPCKSEMPTFNSVYQELNGEVTFVMVDLVGGRETAENGKAYVEQQGFTFPVYFDNSQQAATAYGISSIPTTFFIDKDGMVVSYQRGAMSEDVLKSGIALAQK